MDLKNLPKYCTTPKCGGLKYERCICLICTRKIENDKCSDCEGENIYTHGNDKDYIKCKIFKKDWIKILKFPGMVG